MKIRAEIEATVTAFVADLTELVREAALEIVREALGDLAISQPATRTPPRPARPRRAPRAPAVPAPPPPSELASRSLPAPAPPSPSLPVVVRRFPPKKQRRASTKPIAPAPLAVAPSALEQAPAKPAKSWVVARRPARDRGAAEAAPSPALAE